jgi:hypothetical protein
MRATDEKRADGWPLYREDKYGIPNSGRNGIFEAKVREVELAFANAMYLPRPAFSRPRAPLSSLFRALPYVVGSSAPLLATIQCSSAVELLKGNTGTTGRTECRASATG